MKANIPLADLAEGGKLNFIDTDKIDELMALFAMHNLVPNLSEDSHLFASSLAMLLSSLKWDGNAKNLFDSLPYVRDRDIDLLDIVNTMAHLGFTSHNTIININDIDERLLPCLYIPHKLNASPLVILTKKEGVISAFHARKKQIVEFKAKKEFLGDAYFFEKNNPEKIEEDNQTKKSAGLTWFRIIFGRFRPIINEIVLTSVVINLLSLAMPFFIMSIYNTVIGSGSTDTLIQLVVGVGIAISAEAILRVVRLRLVVWLGVRLDNIVSNTIFEKLLLMKAAYTESASISSQLSRIKTFESVRKFFTGPLFTVIVELPFTVILLTAIWLVAGSLVYIPIVVVILFTMLLAYYQSKIRLATRTAARASSNRQQFGMETFIKMHSLHQNGVSRNWLLRYKDKLSYSATTSFKSNMISSTIETAAHSISILSGVAVVSFGIHSIWNNTLTMGALVATMMLIWRILGPLQTLCSMLPRIEQLKNSIEQINRLVEIEVEHRPTIIKRPIENLSGAIKLTNIGLRYTIDVEPIFVGLDIDVKPGEIIAITGSNGSGKSSLLKLINGLYQPQTGTIRIDGVNIRQLDPIELRNYICYLPQVPNFFEGTIKENLLFANPLATDKDIMDSLEKATGLEELKNLEKGIETVIYGNNAPIPASYTYILNLARAILKKSNILLLDELPNASLNEDVGLAYKKIIQNAKGKKTVFFVSQRDDFIKIADRVIVLTPGIRPAIMDTAKFINQYGT
jgi:ABC-type bacteriocin/lantibiotic exporter with double-glycine peptidase domain